MTIVAVDIGNSETSVGIGGYKSWKSFRFTTRKLMTSDEWFIMLKSTLPKDLDVSKQVVGSIVCSVVPQINNDFLKALKDYLGTNPILLGPGIKTGLSVNIDNPKELGPDRIANSVGGLHKVGVPLIVIDMGTATTIDIVNSKKEYIGGMISPGLKISHDALIDNTASLKSVDFKVPDQAIGKNTYDAIQSGLIIGQASLIDGLIDKALQELAEDASILITGGMGALIGPHLSPNVEYDENLTLDGLAKIYEINS